MKLILLLSSILMVSGCHYPPAGTTVVTKTVTTTTTTSSGDDGPGGLTSGSERALIRSTWEVARKNGNLAPKILFRFLKTYPEYQKMFPTLADVPQAQLMKNGNFLAQAYTIAAGLNVIIQSLGSQELLLQELNHLGTAHFSRGAKLHMFEEFGKVFMSVLDDEMGNKLTAEAKAAMQNGFRGLVTRIASTLKKPEDVPHPVTGMTPHQISDVRRAWETVRGDRSATVSAVFQKLFANNPSLQKSFAAFGDVPAGELSGNAEYKKQVDLVADRLDNMIATLDNTLQIMGQYKYMGHSHAARGIDRTDFEMFGRALLEVLAQKGLSHDDLDSFRAVLRTGVTKIAENLY